MADVAVIVPVLGRPERAAPLAQSLAAAEAGTATHLYFVCTPGDHAQIDACLMTGHATLFAQWPRIRGDYARKINLGLWATPEPYVFCGADDLVFQHGWADAAISAALEQEICFVATNDLGNPLVQKGQHATHPLVCRDYAEECGTIDTPGLIYHEQYWHQYVDNEATGTAKHRGCFGYAADAIVEHMHPIWKKGEQDDTYRLGDEHRAEDRRLWMARRHMWGSL